jgi:hypothetical protein
LSFPKPQLVWKCLDSEMVTNSKLQWEVAVEVSVSVVALGTDPVKDKQAMRPCLAFPQEAWDHPGGWNLAQE